MEKTIYDLKLHEIFCLPDGSWTMRVPGGWVYHIMKWDGGNQEYIDIGSTFVPFDNEFKEPTIDKSEGWMCVYCGKRAEKGDICHDCQRELDLDK